MTIFVIFQVVTHTLSAPQSSPGRSHTVHIKYVVTCAFFCDTINDFKQKYTTLLII